MSLAAFVTAEVVLTLAPADIGALLLIQLNRRPAYSAKRPVNVRNVLNDAVSAYGADVQDDCKRAIAEGWAWLTNNGLLVPAPNEPDRGWYVVSRHGERFRTEDDVTAFSRAEALPRDLLHPRVVAVADAPFTRGNYDSAVFEAFKEIEVAVRTAAGYGPELYGRALMRKAFDTSAGPLSDQSTEKAERESLASLFDGALGSYKNPHSHRRISISAVEAAQMLVLASHLFTIVDARAERRASQDTSCDHSVGQN